MIIYGVDFINFISLVNPIFLSCAFYVFVVIIFSYLFVRNISTYIHICCIKILLLHFFCFVVCLLKLSFLYRKIKNIYLINQRYQPYIYFWVILKMFSVPSLYVYWVGQKVFGFKIKIKDIFHFHQ